MSGPNPGQVRRPLGVYRSKTTGNNSLSWDPSHPLSFWTFPFWTFLFTDISYIGSSVPRRVKCKVKFTVGLTRIQHMGSSWTPPPNVGPLGLNVSTLTAPALLVDLMDPTDVWADRVRSKTARR